MLTGIDLQVLFEIAQSKGQIEVDELIKRTINEMIHLQCPWWDKYQEWVNSKLKKDFGSFPEATACQLLGLSGEAGELCDLVKKKYFHGKDVARDRIVKEFGDALFYLASASDLMGISLTEIVEANILKLNARYPQGFDPSRAHGPGEIPIEEQIIQANQSSDYKVIPVESEDLDMNFPVIKE